MTVPDAVPVVELRGASFAYEDGPEVLSGVDFAVPEGRALALLGRNGGGKTTLLRLLSGGLRCTAGRLRVTGADVAYDRKGLTRLRTTVQLVVQDPDDQLFAASVGQDVSFGPMNLGLPEDEVRTRVREALEALDITALEDRPTHLLSYGQRKRAAIAGAVAMRPRVLILDEPTAGLDPHGQERLLAVLDGLREAGTTVVMATHDVDLALRWADDAAVLVPEGLRTGPVAELLADADLLRAARLRRPWAARWPGCCAAAACSARGSRAQSRRRSWTPGRRRPLPRRRRGRGDVRPGGPASTGPPERAAAPAGRPVEACRMGQRRNAGKANQAASSYPLSLASVALTEWTSVRDRSRVAATTVWQPGREPVLPQISRPYSSNRSSPMPIRAPGTSGTVSIWSRYGCGRPGRGTTPPRTRGTGRR